MVLPAKPETTLKETSLTYLLPELNDLEEGVFTTLLRMRRYGNEPMRYPDC